MDNNNNYTLALKICLNPHINKSCCYAANLGQNVSRGFRVFQPNSIKYVSYEDPFVTTSKAVYLF